MTQSQENRKENPIKVQEKKWNIERNSYLWAGCKLWFLNNAEKHSSMKYCFSGLVNSESFSLWDKGVLDIFFALKISHINSFNFVSDLKLRDMTALTNLRPAASSPISSIFNSVLRYDSYKLLTDNYRKSVFFPSLICDPLKQKETQKKIIMELDSYFTLFWNLSIYSKHVFIYA